MADKKSDVQGFTPEEKDRLLLSLLQERNKTIVNPGVPTTPEYGYRPGQPTPRGIVGAISGTRYGKSFGKEISREERPGLEYNTPETMGGSPEENVAYQMILRSLTAKGASAEEIAKTLGGSTGTGRTANDYMELAKFKAETAKEMEATKHQNKVKLEEWKNQLALKLLGEKKPKTEDEWQNVLDDINDNIEKRGYQIDGSMKDFLGMVVKAKSIEEMNNLVSVRRNEIRDKGVGDVVQLIISQLTPYKSAKKTPPKPSDEKPKPSVPMPKQKIRVKQKSTGATGTMEESEFDPNLYERVK